MGTPFLHATLLQRFARGFAFASEEAAGQLAFAEFVQLHLTICGDRLQLLDSFAPTLSTSPVDQKGVQQIRVPDARLNLGGQHLPEGSWLRLRAAAGTLVVYDHLVLLAHALDVAAAFPEDCGEGDARRSRRYCAAKPQRETGARTRMIATTGLPSCSPETASPSRSKSIRASNRVRASRNASLGSTTAVVSL
eukprot:scaffold48_cov311-Pinguiococcus_pyrenoidosus.AAC.107